LPDKKIKKTTTYLFKPAPFRALKEQLRLFTSKEPVATLEVLPHFRGKRGKREKLAALLAGELNFHGEDSGYASHDLHAFAAKFPPQLPRAFIRGLTNPGDIVLDPMMGSGTTIVEAILEGRQGIGLDIDPLALRLGYVKTTATDIQKLLEAGNKILVKANHFLSQTKGLEQKIDQTFDSQTRKFIDYWFRPDTQRELMALMLAIRGEKGLLSRRFLELTFSSIIITKSGGVSRARDLAHSRPHLDKGKTSKNAIEQFWLRMRKNLNSIAQLKANGTSAMITAGDARSIPLRNEGIDLIVTSPPYANAIDYMRAHKFSLVWFGNTIQELSRLRADYIGSERNASMEEEGLPDYVKMVIDQLNERDAKKAKILLKYFIEMKLVLSEMYRVLRKNAAVIIVVGPSVMRGLNVQTHHCLAETAQTLNFEVVGVVQRTLDRDKRMMPARFGKNNESLIEQRIHDEYVIGLLKH
jgi:DNA modification methylase